MKKILLTLTALICSSLMYGQGARNIMINEVLTHNEASMQDEYGDHLPWIELVNNSFSTYNVRGMFIALDRSVLDPSLSAPQRISKMCIIPNGEARTNMSGRNHLLFFLNSSTAKGKLHLNGKIQEGKPLWIALYDGNGVDLIDSVSVPALMANESFARVQDGKKIWEVKPVDRVTPSIDNDTQLSVSKVDRLKRDDPHGFGITVLSMGIVFFCLALLFVFFFLFGKVIIRARERNKQNTATVTSSGWKKTAPTPGEDPIVVVKSPLKSAPTDDEAAVAAATLAIQEEMATYTAVIAMALKQYSDDVHDVEPGIITIKHHATRWHNEFNNF